jgi:hypothetical protein
MPKKRKLNSKNPKYGVVKQDDRKIKKRVLMCNATATNTLTGKKTNAKVPVYGVWYE